MNRRSLLRRLGFTGLLMLAVANCAPDDSDSAAASEPPGVAEGPAARAPSVTATFEVEPSADPEQVAHLASVLEDRGHEVAQDVDTRIERHEVVVTLMGADEQAVDVLTEPGPVLALGLGEPGIADGQPARCEEGPVGATGACDADGMLYDVEVATPVDLDGTVEVQAEPPVVSIELAPEGAWVLEDLSSDAACRRDRGEPTMLLILMDADILMSATPAAGVRCQEGIREGALSLTFGAEATVNEAEELAARLYQTALPEFWVTTIEQHPGQR